MAYQAIRSCPSGHEFLPSCHNSQVVSGLLSSERQLKEVVEAFLKCLIFCIHNYELDYIILKSEGQEKL